MITYLNDKSVSSHSTLTILDHSKSTKTLGELQVTSGGRVLVEKRTSKGKPVLSTQAMLHSQVITVTIENATKFHSAAESSDKEDKIFHVEIPRDKVSGC